MLEETKTEKKLDILELQKLLPHRYPFLLVDRVIDYDPGKFAKGYKNLTFNEPFFQGHFPSNPIMPGVLQIEAMAQLGAAAFITLPENRNKLILFAGIDNARFKHIVRPGDRLDMEIEVIKIKGPIIKAHAKAEVDGKLAAEADMLFSVMPNQ